MTEAAVTPAADEGKQLSMYGGDSFSSLLAGADYVEGYRLATCAELVGKPFVITGVRFNPGVGASGFFVSCEAVTADNEPVIFNDGSTGIYRQIVAYLTGKGEVDPGPGEESGPSGTCRWDNPLTKWVSPKNADKVAKDNGFPVRLVAPRGLRVSEYDWNGQLAETYYLG